MASIRDVRPVLKQVGLIGFIKRVWQQVGEDYVFTWGSALAYSWLFAIFPFLVFLLSLVPLIPDRIKPNVEQQVNGAIDKILTGDAAAAFKTQVHAVVEPDKARKGYLSFGLILTLWAASGGMSMTISALDRAYDIEKGRTFFRQRLVAIGMTLIVTTLIIAVMVLLPIGTLVLKWLERHSEIFKFAWMIILVNAIRYGLALLLMFAVLAIIYYFGPSFRQKFQAITPGAIFAVAVWLLLGLAFRLYLTKFGGVENYNKTYGAVAGAVILLLFFYLDALVLLLGAEINSEIDIATGSAPLRGQPERPQETARA